MKAPLPDNEAKRLEELLEYKILDTPDEQAFDDLTRLASYICGTPIALISLIDSQRQWFKSKVGLDVSETARELAFCAHAIVQSDVFVVPDATLDERFATNPLVTSKPDVRFYAGVPLITLEKQALGTLCVIDRVPRNLSSEQLEALRILGRQVLKQLELRRNLANLTLQTTDRKQAQKARRQFFRGIAGGFGVASAILIIIGVVSYQSATRLIETNSRVAQTQERLNKLEEVLSQMKDAETGQRGYLLTGEERYLEPYKTAIASIDGEIEHLRKLTANYPNQQGQLDALESAMKNKLAELKGTIDLRKSQGFEAIIPLVRTDLGKKLMDDIRSRVREMETQENELLKQQVAEAGTSARYTIVTLAIGIVLTFVILCGIYLLIYREITERQWVEEALKKERNFISAVIDTSSALVVVLDREGKIVRFNRACEQITAYSFDEVRDRYFWNLFLIPEELETVKAIFAKLQAGQFPNESENYWVTKDGSRRLIAWSNTTLLNNQGLVEFVIGTGIDITERKQAEKALQESEEQYRSVVDNLQEVIFQTDTARRLTFLNPAWTEITGLSVYESIGKRFLELIHPGDRQLQDEQFQSLLECQNEDCRYQVRYLTKNAGVAHMEVYACVMLADDNSVIGISGTLNDITERKRREQQLSAEHATARVLAESVTLSEATPKILAAICESLGWDVGELWSVDASANVLRRVETWHRQSVDVSEFEAVSREMTFAPGVGLPGLVWESAEPTWIVNVVEDGNFLRTSIAAKVGLHAAFGFPILNGDERLGVMSFFSREVQQPDTDLLKTMAAIGSQIGQFIKRKQAEEELQRQNQILQAELNQAAEYVRSLLPRPLTETVTTEAQFIPSLQLGGDAFDYYWLDADHLAVYLLDVAGHGVRSALLSVSVLNVLRSQSLPNTNFYQPSVVLSALNRVFQMNENGDDYFTIWYGVYNRVKRELVYACAGHPPALLLSDASMDTPGKELGLLSIPIGMLPEADFDDDSCKIPPGSTLYLFSDGVYEIIQPDGQLWGLNAFIDVLTDYKKGGTGNLEQVLHHIQNLNGDKALDDDFSLLQINLN
ncbi:PAS domain S-box protein [Allocoleopsis sp.]|uniref:PAS domain S-box protein n=1 Tax=Allocoleopsis sp. TaxID=3088169 RepID=UPI0032C21016